VARLKGCWVTYTSSDAGRGTCALCSRLLVTKNRCSWVGSTGIAVQVLNSSSNQPARRRTSTFLSRASNPSSDTHTHRVLDKMPPGVSPRGQSVTFRQSAAVPCCDIFRRSAPPEHLPSYAAGTFCPLHEQQHEVHLPDLRHGRGPWMQRPAFRCSSFGITAGGTCSGCLVSKRFRSVFVDKKTAKHPRPPLYTNNLRRLTWEGVGLHGSLFLLRALESVLLAAARSPRATPRGCGRPER